MIFTINHIDAKSRSQNKTKIFSRSAFSEKAQEQSVEDLARISSLGIILSKSGLDNKRSRFINSGESIDFRLLFNFNPAGNLIVKGSYLIRSGHLKIEADGMIQYAISNNKLQWTRITFSLDLKNVRPKRINMENLNPDIQNQLAGVCGSVCAAVRDRENSYLNDMNDYLNLLIKDKNLDYIFGNMIYQIFAVGQLRRYSTSGADGAITAPGSTPNTFSVETETLVPYLQKIKWSAQQVQPSDML